MEVVNEVCFYTKCWKTDLESPIHSGGDVSNFRLIMPKVSIYLK